MKVVFYLSRHVMPFSSGKEIRPYRLFDPEMMSDWIETASQRESMGKEIPDNPDVIRMTASEHPFWPMLLALSELGRDDMMAHINAIFGSNAFRFQDRTVVRITSAIPLTDEYGVPAMRPTDTLELICEPDLPKIFSGHDDSELGSVGFWTRRFEAAIPT